MSKGTCSTEGCDRPVRARGLCINHYKAGRRSGLLRLVNIGGQCSVEECFGRVHGRGLCSKHYQRWKKYGDPLAIKPRPTRPSKPCAVNGCTNLHYMRDWCCAHYQRWRKYGDPLGLGSPRKVNFCSVADCERRCRGRGLCGMHLQRVTRAENLERSRAHSRRWQKAHLDRASDQAAKRRARQKKAVTEDVRRDCVMERDGWTCQLCGSPIDPNSPKLDPLSPSLDHIVPLARGGTHTYDNVQAAHLRCNMQKGARAS